MISSSFLQLSRGFFAISQSLFPFPIISLSCVPLMWRMPDGVRPNFDWSSHELRRQHLQLLQLHPHLLLLLPRMVWLLRWLWCSFSAWMPLTLSAMSCVRWTPVSVVLHDNRLTLVALLSLPLLLQILLRMKTTMMALMAVVMRMVVLAPPAMMRWLLELLALCHTWQKGEVVLGIRC